MPAPLSPSLYEGIEFPGFDANPLIASSQAEMLQLFAAAKLVDGRARQGQASRGLGDG